MDIPRSTTGGAESAWRPGHLTVFSLRKWTRLALKGNPTVLLLLFIPPEHLYFITPLGLGLMDLAPAFVERNDLELVRIFDRRSFDGTRSNTFIHDLHS